MKGFKGILIILLFLICIFLGKVYYESKKEHVVFYELISLRDNLSEKLLKNFFSNDKPHREAAQKQIKEIVLKDLGYSDWIDYLDYIEMLIYPIDIIDDNNEEFIIAMNISKDIGVIGIYKKHNGMYIINNIIDNLTIINNISAIKDTNQNRTFLLIEQTLDEQIGAYFTDNYIQIFTKSESEFEEVFRQSLDYCAFYYEKWTSPSLINPKWFKITEKSIIDHIANEHGNLVLFMSKTISKYEGASSDDDNVPSNFKLVEQINFDTKYTWDNKYNSFIINKGEIISSKKIVAILEDTSQTVDYLLNLTNKYYKVIDEDNNVLYIDENDLKIN